MRRKTLLLVFCVVATAMSCLKSSNTKTCSYPQVSISIPTAEQQALATYIDTNNIDATLDNHGFYYKIITPGSGTDTMTLCSQVQISSKGQLVNDSTFDQENNAVFVLGSLIEGWKKGIPKIKRGGEIKLYIPPSLGYGGTDVTDNTGKVVIPKNSILKFDIKLVDYTTGI